MFSDILTILGIIPFKVHTYNYTYFCMVSNYYLSNNYYVRKISSGSQNSEINEHPKMGVLYLLLGQQNLRVGIGAGEGTLTPGLVLGKDAL